jgi:hypothetical protein
MMQKFHKMLEITKIIIEKNNELKNIDKVREPQIYESLNNEIIEFKIELEDLKHILLADSSIALDESDKKMEEIRNQIDFENMESDELRLFGKIHNAFTELERELEILDFSESPENILPPSDANLLRNEMEDDLNNALPL